LYQEETKILSNQNDGTDSTTTLSTTTTTTSKSTYELLNQDHDETHPPLDTIKIVAISDTHGFEQQLTMNEQLLPDGDVVLHCSDFALDGSYSDEYKGLKAFDLWLAKQPHKYKIVLRGNHEPWKFDFVFSKAWYCTQPELIKLEDFTMALIPHGHPNLRKLEGSSSPWSKVSKPIDILVTHVPPYETLDKTFAHKHAGSKVIANVVWKMGE